jgi:hypothetical protein
LGGGGGTTFTARFLGTFVLFRPRAIGDAVTTGANTTEETAGVSVLAAFATCAAGASIFVAAASAFAAFAACSAFAAFGGDIVFYSVES